jgi:hypothetical protein
MAKVQAARLRTGRRREVLIGYGGMGRAIFFFGLVGLDLGGRSFRLGELGEGRRRSEVGDGRIVFGRKREEGRMRD